MGIFRALTRPTYENLLQDQIDRAISTRGAGNLHKLLNSGETWVIGADGQPQ
jgi:2-oxoglutarate ferredoxin oxidoreductase subunit beta